MLVKSDEIKSLSTVSNAIELGVRIIQSVSGDTLNGNKMEEVTETLGLHLTSELKKKGNV